MLRSLRNKSQSIFFKIFLVLIIIGFAAWGVGDLTGGSNNKPVFKTEDHEINLQTIIKEFDKSRNSLPQPLSIEDAIKSGILNQVLINNKIKILIDQEGANQKLTVPRHILKKKIGEDKIFFDSGKFSAEKFKLLLNQNQLSEEEYLNKLSTELLNNHILFPINTNKKYNNGFVKKFITWENKTLDINYYNLPYISKTSIKLPNDSELTEYYKKDTSKYYLPKFIDFSYALFEAKNFEAFVDFSENDLKKLYEENKNNYVTTEKRDFFQIIFNRSSSAESFVKSLNADNNFIKHAKKLNYSEEDISFSDMSKDQLQDKLVNYIFDTPINNVIGPLKTNFGYHVIQVKKIIPKKIIPFNEVKPNLKKDFINDKATEILYDNLDKINDLVFSGNTLDEIVKMPSLGKNNKVLKVKNLTKEGNIYNKFDITSSKLNQKFVSEIWKQNVNELSELIEIDQDKYVLILIEKKENRKDLNFTEAKPLVIKNYLKDEVIKLTLEKAKILSKDTNLDSKFLKLNKLKRFNNNLSNSLFTNEVINKIFNFKNNKINFLETNSGILMFKIIKVYYEDNKNENAKKLVERNFNSSFNSDIKNKFFEYLESKHNLKSNFEMLNSIIDKN